MKNNLTKRSLCIVLVAVMLLGLSVINASACSCPSSYWEIFEYYEYTQLSNTEHDVKKTEEAQCRACLDVWVISTHWYSEDHDIVTYCLRYIDSIQMYEYEDYCPLCGYGEIYYLPY
ncbi:MAG TPA: hypothetical protein PLS36_05885 [Clostridia bacterium]|nr:hypothetical protein [Clostridia bacterium]